MSNLKELVVSWIRTALVPPIAALVIQFFIQRGFQFNEGLVINAVTFLLIGLWYLVFRAIELLARNPRIKRLAGIFLGYPRYPVETTPRV